jgi:ABC-type long-subunit fatty acid transport system fused permease/ATPase subunit
VPIGVMINNWCSTFYNFIQQAPAKAGAVTWEEFFGQFAPFGAIAMLYIITAFQKVSCRSALSVFQTAEAPRIAAT